MLFLVQELPARGRGGVVMDVGGFHESAQLVSEGDSGRMGCRHDGR